jgi:excisionase family DNA binding protein
VSRARSATAGSVADWAAAAVSDLPSICTVDEAIGVLRMSRRHFYRQTSTGRIRTLKHGDGGRLLVPRAELARYLESLAGTV